MVTNVKFEIQTGRTASNILYINCSLVMGSSFLKTLYTT